MKMTETYCINFKQQPIITYKNCIDIKHINTDNVSKCHFTILQVPSFADSFINLSSIYQQKADILR